MAQYPQGIFQSLQWLLKKVKILALDKQPTYVINTLNGSYVIRGRGVYLIQNVGFGTTITFPDPALMNGQSITIINTDQVSQDISSDFIPINGATPGNITEIVGEGYYQFISIGGQWRGVLI